MKNRFLHSVIMLILGSLFSGSAWSQGGFKLPDGKERGKLKFELVNNLIIIPVEINDVSLSFLLDTGVTSTLLFGATKDTLKLKNVTTVKFRGLGKGDAVEALKSRNNTIKVGKAIDSDHTLYTIFDKDINLSNRMGVPVHGILGYDFFKDLVISINYNSKTIKYCTPESFKEKEKKGYTTYPILIDRDRPFMDNIVVNNEEESLMLIDIGSSDSVWYFDDNIISGEANRYFTDLLGLGLSGNIYGKRSRISRVAVGDFDFKNVNIAVPESLAVVSAKLMKERKGSIGAQLMKRFNIIFNYRNGEISLKKNSFFDDPFYYNMSGLTLEHFGLSAIKTKVGRSIGKTGSAQDGNSEATNYTPDIKYKISLAPSVIISEVKRDSAADKSGIMIGDRLVAINGKFAHEYKLYEINSIFSSKEGKLINLLVERNGNRFKKKFYLTSFF